MNIRALEIVCCLMLAVPISTFAAGGVVTGPNEIAPDRYVYYPGTEVLAEDEIRIIACGTGMPDQRLAQAQPVFYSNWVMVINSSSILDRGRCATSRH